MKFINKKIISNIILCSLILISLNACSGRISNHGVLNINNKIDTIIENKLEKAEVEALLGPPSTISSFEFNKWYYISSTIKHVAFYKPEIINHRIYEIIFNSENQAIEINSFDEKDLNDISYNKDYTETKGNTQTLLQNILRGVSSSNIK